MAFLYPSVEVLEDWPAPGATATNSLFEGIKIWKRTRFFGGVLAQEYWDFYFKALPPLIVPLVVIAYILGFADNTDVSSLLVTANVIVFGLVSYMMTYVLWTIIPAIERFMEGTGQAIEVVVAHQFYNADLEKWLDYEADVLANHYEMFEGFSVEEAREYLDERLPLAKRVVSLFPESIAGFVQLGKEARET